MTETSEYWDARLPIINRAMAVCGAANIDSYDDGSIESDFAVLHWQDIVDWAFQYRWSWAKTQSTLSHLVSDPTARFANAWQAPPDMLSLIGVTRNGNPVEYDLYANKIFTRWNEDNVLVADYIAYVDIAEWPPAFRLAVIFRMASMFISYTTTQDELMEFWDGVAIEWLFAARRIDAQQRATKKIRTNRFLGSRFD